MQAVDRFNAVTILLNRKIPPGQPPIKPIRLAPSLALEAKDIRVDLASLKCIQGYFGVDRATVLRWLAQWRDAAQPIDAVYQDKSNTFYYAPHVVDRLPLKRQRRRELKKG